jgi:hypothetical protein
MKKLLLCFAIGSVLITSCKKKEDDDDDNGGGSSATHVAALSFDNIIFNQENAFFSTDGSMTAPVDSNTAKTISSKIDFTYIVNWDVTEEGFMDPKARSQHWYWDDYYSAWLSNSVETEIYSTALTTADYDAAKSDQSKIGECFSKSTTVLVPHYIFGEGTCIGGRQCSDPNTGENSIMLSHDKVFAFKNVASGKRGLFYFPTGQVQAWPEPFLSDDTKVNIIREK